MSRGPLLAVLTSCLLASAAQAELPEPQRHGPACTPAGCSGRGGSPTGRAAGFGLAVLGALALARRDGARSDAKLRP
ncbi:MAG: hypothetical protein JRH16_07680 [Deltaproteobacteria bacterium]|nr:hypothetical protein [Deltaproteobacteria bacterium]MBW2361869.1 hypothetical protein [Deltaproteobacteria bacterium]